MKKILYFEGAGCVSCNDVENCRIRTAFTNRDGKKIYIEFICGHIYGKSKKEPEFNYLVCDYCFYITDDPNTDDCNYSRLDCSKKVTPTNKQIEYTKENILTFVNKNCNADFDEIVVLDDLAGFRVHADGKNNTPEAYNYGDVFKYNAELTEKRIAKVKELKKHFTILFNQKHDNTSYYIENNQLVVCINVEERKRIEAGYTERKFIVEV